jgi:putative drug exporter of the RND superfamily
MGFALAIGVAIDAFVVRLTIVPAVMSLLGRSAWWLPRWLARVLPNVDIEGQGLRRRLHSAPDRERELISV